ncbi:hypothetical protein IAU59_006966 [Kwoniella sp. CBS 9459]
MSTEETSDRMARALATRRQRYSQAETSRPAGLSSAATDHQSESSARKTLDPFCGCCSEGSRTGPATVSPHTEDSQAQPSDSPAPIASEAGNTAHAHGTVRNREAEVPPDTNAGDSDRSSSWIDVTDSGESGHERSLSIRRVRSPPTMGSRGWDRDGQVASGSGTLNFGEPAYGGQSSGPAPEIDWSALNDNGSDISFGASP